MKNGLVCLLIGFCLLSLSSLGQQLDTTLFEAHVYVEGNQLKTKKIFVR